MAQSRRPLGRRRTLSAAVFSVLAILANVWALPAFAMCCKCTDTKTSNGTLCLLDSTISSCTDLVKANDKNANLASVTCTEQYDDAHCQAQNQDDPQAACVVGPTLGISYDPVSQAVIAPTVEPVVPPNLNVTIPGLTFSSVQTVGDSTTFPWLAQYVAAAYDYLIGVSIIAAAVMLVWGGTKYIVGSSTGGISSAKATMTDAVVGLFLVLAIYTILKTIAPATSVPGSMTLPNIERLSYNAPTPAEVEYDLKVAKGQVPPPPSLPRVPATPEQQAAARTPSAPLPSTPPPSDAQAPPVPPPPASGSTPGAGTEVATGAGGGPGCPGPDPSKPRSALEIPFDWAPPDYFNYYAVEGSKLVQHGLPQAQQNQTLQRILIDPRIINCPGSYPVIFFFHGNDGWAGLDTPNHGAVWDFKLVMSGSKAIWGNTKPNFQPVIIVFPASVGKSEQLFPGMTLPALRDAALAELQKHPETKGVTFSSYSVQGHSGAGCAPVWGHLNDLPLYEITYSDTCFGVHDATHNPQKLVGIVSKTMDYSDWPTFLVKHGMTQQRSCKYRYNGAQIQGCYQAADKDYFFYHAADNNHGTPITFGFQFALQHFFSP